MRREVGPDGNYIFENDTVGGVPAFIYTSISSRINTQRGRGIMRPDYGADFLSCVGQDDPLDAVRSEVLRALGDDIGCSVAATENLDTNTVDIELSGDAESGDWSMNFGIALEDGSVAYFPDFVVDGR